MAVRNLVLFPGDGIGPEAMAEVEKIIAWMNEARGAGFETDSGLVGGSAYDAHGKAISEEDMAKAMRFPFTVEYDFAGDQLKVRRAAVETIHGKVALVRR